MSSYNYRVYCKVEKRYIYTYSTTLPTECPNDSGHAIDSSRVFSFNPDNHIFNATTPPTVNDDSSVGYSIGSHWVDITGDKAYVCVDASVGAAIWVETTSTGGGAGNINVPLSSIDKGLVRFDGTDGDTLEEVGIRHYGALSSDPVSPTPIAGDQYYNTTINHEMRYDGVRSKWLSVATLIDGCGKSGSTSKRHFYRRFNGMTLSAVEGPYVAKGTIVSIGYSTSKADSHIFEVLVNGSVVASLSSGGAVSAFDDTINGDFDAGIMSFRNASNSKNNSQNLQAVVYYKLRN